MLIIDMQMPRTCAECPICQFDNECGDLYHRCGETLNLCERPYEDRNEDCPIKGVLPEQHGDLVDADTVLWGEEVPDSEGIVVPVTIGDVIEGYDVPIVIAAERSET